MEPALSQPPDLIGQWSLSRQVIDFRAGRAGTVRGSLTLEYTGGRIEWLERGRLCWDGAEVPVERRYLLRPADGGAWWAFFDDGRAFHPWRPGEWVEHLCGADRYRGLVTLEDADHWQVIWDVRGPHKAHRLTTRLSSAGHGPRRAPAK